MGCKYHTQWYFIIKIDVIFRKIFVPAAPRSECGGRPHSGFYLVVVVPACDPGGHKGDASLDAFQHQAYDVLLGDCARSISAIRR